MYPRSPDEKHRTATPLELFFDLVFVVAVAQAGSRLHHKLAEGNILEAVVSYSMVFFAIWWAWMNFTWFASAYDTDDIPYRLAVFVQLTGALILSAGIPAAFEERNFTIATLGYIVMRLPLVAQWLRAAHGDPDRKACAYRFAVGVTACQLGWMLLLFVPRVWFGFPLLALAELFVPIWAERKGPTQWHAEHIMERYGLFTMIVLGETILSASLAIQSVTQTSHFDTSLIPIIAGGLLILFSMWWLYFDQPRTGMLTSLRTAFVWGYSHLFIFASAAAVGAGLSVAVDHVFHHTEISTVTVGATVSVPVVIYVFVLWALHQGPGSQSLIHPILFPLVALLILLAPLTGQAMPVTGLLLAILVIIKVVSRYRTAAQTASISERG